MTMFSETSRDEVELAPEDFASALRHVKARARRRQAMAAIPTVALLGASWLLVNGLFLSNPPVAIDVAADDAPDVPAAGTEVDLAGPPVDDVSGMAAFGSATGDTSAVGSVISLRLDPSKVTVLTNVEPESDITIELSNEPTPPGDASTADGATAAAADRAEPADADATTDAPKSVDATDAPTGDASTDAPTNASDAPATASSSESPSATDAGTAAPVADDPAANPTVSGLTPADGTAPGTAAPDTSATADTSAAADTSADSAPVATPSGSTVGDAADGSHASAPDTAAGSAGAGAAASAGEASGAADAETAPEPSAGSAAPAVDDPSGSTADNAAAATDPATSSDAARDGGLPSSGTDAPASSPDEPSAEPTDAQDLTGSDNASVSDSDEVATPAEPTDAAPDAGEPTGEPVDADASSPASADASAVVSAPADGATGGDQGATDTDAEPSDDAAAGSSDTVDTVAGSTDGVDTTGGTNGETTGAASGADPADTAASGADVPANTGSATDDTGAAAPETVGTPETPTVNAAISVEFVSMTIQGSTVEIVLFVSDPDGWRVDACGTSMNWGDGQTSGGLCADTCEAFGPGTPPGASGEVRFVHTYEAINATVAPSFTIHTGYECFGDGFFGQLNPALVLTPDGILAPQ